MDNRTAVATLLDRNSPLTEVAAHLDALDHATRLEQCRALGRTAQRVLFNLASADQVRLEDLVPASVAPRTEVIQFGMNTLPLPGAMRRFEKRFCRPDDGSARLFGFNEGSTRALIGPGYFVAVPTAGNEQWQQRGAVVVDYYQVPDGPVVEGWPKVVPNSSGLQRFVFQGTRDFMRRVSDWVTIGAAYKGEKALDHYFVLVRNPG
ncbi:MAG: hypothetical protein FJ100_13155 [Deltaproteobacteria bacterium]|nr:hypothetical protein [Deltaproteobacteria bacterium]